MSGNLLRYAAIDIGTNSVLLLAVEVNKTQQLDVLSEQRYSTRISGDVKTTGEIDSQTEKLLFKRFDSFQKVIQSYQIDQVAVCATQRFRIAPNGNEIIEKINQRYNWQAEIISGREEAKLSFSAASIGINNIKNQRLVIDVGGGSTEIIFGSEDKILSSHSSPIGAVSLTAQMNLAEKVTDSKIDQTYSYLQNIFENIKIPKATDDISTLTVGGTASTLAAISLNMKKFDPDKIHGVQITSDWIKAKINNLANMNLSERKELISFDPDRADIIVAGAIIIFWIIKRANIDSIICSNRGLRWGLLYNKFLLE